MDNQFNYTIDICYIVSHGFASRMILQTDLLGRLVDQGLRVGLIAPDAEDENLKSYCENRGVKLFEYQLTNRIWSEDYWVRRRYILEDIKQNPALWEKHLKAKSFRSNKSKHPWRHLRPRVYYPLNQLAQRFPAFRSWFKRNEAKFLSDTKAEQFIEQRVNPKLLVSTYPVNLQEAILLAAGNKVKGVKTCIHLLSWDNITSKGHFPALADEYIAWGPIMKREFQSHYQIEDARIHVCGVPHFDEHVNAKTNVEASQAAIQNLGLDPQKPYLFFAMSSPYFAPREIDIVEWLADRISDASFGENVQLVVRPHPQNVQGHMADTSWLPRLKAIERVGVAVDYPLLVKSKLKWSMKQEDMNKLSSLLAGCAVSLNSGSTVSIDALMVGKPVILTSFDAGEELPYWNSARRLVDFVHLKKLVGYKGVSVVSSYRELKAEIVAYLNDPDRHITARTLTLQEECGPADGRATERVSQALAALIN